MNKESLKGPILALLIMFLVGALLSGVVMVGMDLPLDGTMDASNPKVLVVLILSTLVGIVMAMAYAVHRVGWTWLRFGALSAKDVAWAIGMVPMVMLVSFSWAGFLELLDQPVDPQRFVQGIIETTNTGTLVFGFAYVILLAPLLEEALFRGYMLPVMMGNLGRWQGFTLNALLFGSVHASDPWSVLPTAFIGLGACWLWDRTKSLSAPVLFHTVNNLCAMGMLWFY